MALVQNTGTIQPYVNNVLMVSKTEAGPDLRPVATATSTGIKAFSGAGAAGESVAGNSQVGDRLAHCARHMDGSFQLASMSVMSSHLGLWLCSGPPRDGQTAIQHAMQRVDQVCSCERAAPFLATRCQQGAA